MRGRWGLLLVPPVIISCGLLFVTQFVFLRFSFFKDLRLGRFEESFQLTNYLEFFQDPFYLWSLKLTIVVGLAVASAALLFGYPAAYVLARMNPRWSTRLLAAIVISAFITIVIKVLGLIIVFGSEGPINSALRALGMIEQPLTIYGSITGVVIGMLQFTLPFMILILFSVIQTIPRSLEEAAEIHGASRWRVMWRVVFPLSLPGVVGGTLIVFNIAMGAFTSAALLGGGRVLTLPVLIQQTVIADTKYAMGATISAILLMIVLLINLLSVFLVKRLRAARLGVT